MASQTTDDIFTPEMKLVLLEQIAEEFGLVKQYYCSSMNKDGGICHAFPSSGSDKCMVHSRSGVQSKLNPNPPFAFVLAKKVKEVSAEIQKPDRIPRCHANTLKSTQCKNAASHEKMCMKHIGHIQCDEVEPVLFRCSANTADGSRCSIYGEHTTCSIHTRMATKAKEQESTPKKTGEICQATQKNGVACPNPAINCGYCGKHKSHIKA